uniref:Uncharacterized protein n=1 Tax=Mesocestoides corti TaxID=53468 RepID=A0A5K3FSD9_MESCO
MLQPKSKAGQRKMCEQIGSCTIPLRCVLFSCTRNLLFEMWMVSSCSMTLYDPCLFARGNAEDRRRKPD